jgi:hypothetical protein
MNVRLLPARSPLQNELLRSGWVVFSTFQLLKEKDKRHEETSGRCQTCHHVYEEAQEAQEESDQYVASFFSHPST